jgi:hypothetical protein
MPSPTQDSPEGDRSGGGDENASVHGGKLLDAWGIVELLAAGWRWGVAGMTLQDPSGALHTVRRRRSKYEVTPIPTDPSHKDA